MKRTYGVTRAALGIGATTAAPGQRALGRSSGVPLPLDDALAFVPHADRERSSRCAVGDVRRASVASRSPALPPPRPLSRAGVLGGVTAGAAVLWGVR